MSVEMGEEGEREREGRERFGRAECEKRERSRGPELKGIKCGCEDPHRAVEGWAAGSSRGCFRCTPYQPAARCSDPMPMSEKSIEWVKAVLRSLSCSVGRRTGGRQ